MDTDIDIGCELSVLTQPTNCLPLSKLDEERDVIVNSDEQIETIPGIMII